MGSFHDALATYDRITGLDLRKVAIDRSLRKTPCGGLGLFFMQGFRSRDYRAATSSSCAFARVCTRALRMS